MDEPKVTESIILLTLKELNISKSPGPDEIGARLLTELSENTCLPLQKIFETSIKTSNIPDEWKDAKISAIYKKGNKKSHHQLNESQWSVQSKTIWFYLWQINSSPTN